VFKFAGVDSISDAEALVGCEVQIPSSARASLEPNEAYVSDLIGSRVFAGDPLRDIGVIEKVDFSAGEAPLLVVRAGTREILVPLAAEFIRELDLPNKRLEMALPEGLLDLDVPVAARKRQPRKPKPKK